MHIHKYRFESKKASEHIHTLEGYTDNMVGINAFHFHFYYGICTYNGHTHYFSGITGVPVKTDFGHIHRMDGAMELNSMHEHEYDSYTFENIGYNVKRSIKVAYI
jgi:hypothetical protein